MNIFVQTNTIGNDPYSCLLKRTIIALVSKELKIEIHQWKREKTKIDNSIPKIVISTLKKLLIVEFKQTQIPRFQSMTRSTQSSTRKNIMQHLEKGPKIRS